jgi:hypothetical protein
VTKTTKRARPPFIGNLLDGEDYVKHFNIIFNSIPFITLQDA